MAERAQAVAEHIPQGQVIAADPASVMAMISRAAGDPTTDVDKFDRMLAMFERVSARAAEIAFSDAMNATQAEMRPIAADATNPQTKSKYASLPALDRALRPIYTRHGFSLSYNTGDGAPPEHVRVLCYASHNEGFSRTYQVDMPADGKGAKGGDVMTKTHASGAAMSYGQRYLLKLIFNIAVGEDLDGNDPRERGGSGAKQAAVAAVNACKTLEELRTWKTKNADGLKLMPSDEADEVVRLVNDRMRRLKDATAQ